MSAIVHTIPPFYKAGPLLLAFMLMTGPEYTQSPPDTRLGKGLTYNKKVTDWEKKNIDCGVLEIYLIYGICQIKPSLSICICLSFIPQLLG